MVEMSKRRTVQIEIEFEREYSHEPRADDFEHWLRDLPIRIFRTEVRELD
jgi:hypothetical protein